jgi:hypothetical protein
MVGGYHGPQDMGQLIQWGRNQIAHQQHWVSATVGPPGSGKSGFNICLAIALQDPTPFDPVRQIAMRPMDRKPLSQALPPGCAIVDDESTGMGGHRRRSMSRENVDNIQDFDAMRGRRQATILTGPDYQDFDGAIKKHVSWVFDLKKDKTATVYEVVPSGRPDNRYYNLQQRFYIERTPHASILYPDVWASYMRDQKGPYLAGFTPMARLQGEDHVARVAAGLRAMLGG